jgi:hypothetical protein
MKEPTEEKPEAEGVDEPVVEKKESVDSEDGDSEHIEL